MFEENENPVIEEVTENVEETTEELTDGATESEEDRINRLVNERLDELLPKKIARKEAKIRKEYDKKYGRLENVLKAGTGEEDLDKVTDAFTDFYTKKGVEIPNSTPHYSQREMEILANAEADEIIALGYEEIKEEVDRYANIGVDNMSAQDKLIFSKLAKERSRIEDKKALASIGVTETDDNFEEFANKLNPDLSMTEKYEMYTKLNPKKEVKPIGSMKSGQMEKVKDYYTEDEISRMSLDDLNDPRVWEAVRKSMTGQI